MVVGCVEDYKEMLTFKKHYEECLKKHPDDDNKIKYALQDHKIFKDKIQFLKNYTKTGNVMLNNDKLW